MNCGAIDKSSGATLAFTWSRVSWPPAESKSNIHSPCCSDSIFAAGMNMRLHRPHLGASEIWSLCPAHVTSSSGLLRSQKNPTIKVAATSDATLLCFFFLVFWLVSTSTCVLNNVMAEERTALGVYRLTAASCLVPIQPQCIFLKRNFNATCKWGICFCLLQRQKYVAPQWSPSNCACLPFSMSRYMGPLS